MNYDLRDLLGGTGIGWTGPGPLCAGSRRGASGQSGQPGPAAPGGGDRGDHRRRVLGQPAPRGRLRAEDLAGLASDRRDVARRSCSNVRCRSSPAALARVAPAVERPGIHLGVVAEGDGVCGVGHDARPPDALLRRSKWPRPDCSSSNSSAAKSTTKFVNVAVLEGDQIKFVDEQASSLPDCPSLLTSLLGFDAPASWERLGQRARAARGLDARARPRRPAAGRAGRRRPRGGIRSCCRFRTRSVAAVLRLRGADASERRRPATRRGWQDALSRAVEAIAGLTAVDGATVITDRYDLLAFGAKIARRQADRRRSSRSPSPSRSKAASRHRPPDAARRHPPPVGRAVRPRSARRGRARGVAGRPLHDLRVVALRRHGPRAPRRDALALKTAMSDVQC